MYDKIKRRIRGLNLNQPTPYKPGTFELDREGLRRNIEHWVANKVPVIMLTAGSSDFLSLSEEEIREVTKITVETVAGRAVVIASTAATWWQGQTIRFARYCEEIGADALMVIKTEPAAATPEDYYNFHKAIADASPIPLMYHSSLLGPKSVAVLRRVLEIPAVIAMKQETETFTQYSLLRDNFGDRLAVVSAGGGEIAYHAHQFGAVGSLTGTGQWAPAAEVRFGEDLLAGNLEAARAHLRRIVPFRRVAAATNNILAIKHAMDMAGLAGGPPRPLSSVPLTEAQKAEVAAAVRATGLLA